jgi:hypothetical protein
MRRLSDGLVSEIRTALEAAERSTLREMGTAKKHPVKKLRLYKAVNKYARLIQHLDKELLADTQSQRLREEIVDAMGREAELKLRVTY